MKAEFVLSLLCLDSLQVWLYRRVSWLKAELDLSLLCLGCLQVWLWVLGVP